MSKWKKLYIDGFVLKKSLNLPFYTFLLCISIVSFRGVTDLKLTHTKSFLYGLFFRKSGNHLHNTSSMGVSPPPPSKDLNTCHEISLNTFHSHQNNRNINNVPVLRHSRVVLVNHAETQLIIQAEHKHDGIYPLSEL